ncbi:hypothetical protein BH11PSE11_BH11PSE11_36250 [soil metagenome]
MPVRFILVFLLLAIGLTPLARAGIPASERAVLDAIFASANGSGWTLKTGWTSAGGECSWHGITCNVNQTNITEIRLENNGLSGTLPSLSALPALQFFSVYHNNLTGSIPSLSSMTSLKYVWLHENAFTGSIPAIGGLNQLIHFYVDHNQLSGSLPTLSGLSALQIFSASNNQLTGPIPSLAGLKSLQNFWVFANQLSGPIPPLAGLTALSQFQVQENQLTGDIPSLAGLSSLQFFYVHINSLSGPIPPLAGLTALLAFDAERNELSGPVPAPPASLKPNGSRLCANKLTSSGNAAIDSAWNAATASNWLACQISTPAPAPVILSVFKTGEGSVSSSPSGIDCGSTCSASFAVGTDLILSAMPATGYYFAGWSGACSGSANCQSKMSEPKKLTASFKPSPFTPTTSISGTASSTTLRTTIVFNPADVGKTGGVYVTGWVPRAGLAKLGISAPDSTRITRTADNPHLTGAGNVHGSSGTLGDTDPAAFVLVQLTASGWQLVVDGQLVPYASGVLGEALAAQTILANTDTTALLGAQFCLGYGTTSSEMVASGRMLPVTAIPGGTVTSATAGSCNVAASAPPSPYTGLWWKADESGWGMSLTQQGSTIFVAWYAYDGAGNPTWYVMSACALTGSTCSGTIYSVSGGTSPVVPWNGEGKLVKTAGSGTISFSGNDAANFSYTLNNVTSSRAITRQVFATGTAAPLIDYSALWWNPDESGWGVALTQQYGMIFAALYTYDANGNAIWYVASSCPMTGNSCSGALYQVNGGTAPGVPWNGASKTVASVGTVSFLFTDGSLGTMTLSINGVNGTKAITRQLF